MRHLRFSLVLSYWAALSMAAGMASQGIETNSQTVARCLTSLDVWICDWPSLKYRGVQQDISRGQVPTPETLKRLASVLAQAKMNELELYIEHEYKFKAFLNEPGPYLVGCTFFATLLKQSPIGLPAAPYGKIDPALAETIQKTVWKVVSKHTDAGVAEK